MLRRLDFPSRYSARSPVFRTSGSPGASYLTTQTTLHVIFADVVREAALDASQDCRIADGVRPLLIGARS